MGIRRDPLRRKWYVTGSKVSFARQVRLLLVRGSVARVHLASGLKLAMTTTIYLGYV
ncbi:hypothetical protein LguiA_022176 [Lonicera macranthoides]